MLPMVVLMNAMAQVSAAPLTGPKLDNRRILAAIVDLVIVSAGALVILYAGDALTGDRGGALAAVILGWALYYYFALESGSGQTVGKKLMNLRVVRADGRPVGMREIAVRTILRVVDGIGVYIVGLIVMLVTGERRQRIGDLAAGTIVVDASGPATAVAEAVTPEAEAAVEDDEPAEAAQDEPAAEAVGFDRTITLPARPEPPATLSDLADEPEPVVEPDPVVEAEPVVEAQPVVDAESVEVEPYQVEPIDLDSAAPVEPTVEADAPEVEAEEPAAEVEDADAEDDQPMTVKSVETVSAMDLIMGAADEDSAKSDEDEGPVSP